MRADLEPLVIPLYLVEGSRHCPVTIVEDEDGNLVPFNATDTFLCNLLNSSGGVIGTIAATLVTDGSDAAYQEIYEIAEIEVLKALGTLATWQFFHIPTGDATLKELWYHGPATIGVPS